MGTQLAKLTWISKSVAPRPICQPTRRVKKMHLCFMHCRIKTKCPILEIWLVPERKFSNLNFELWFFDSTELYKFQFQFFPQNFLRSFEIMFRNHKLTISCRWSILFTILLLHSVNRAFLKGARSFSLNKSANFEGSYDHLKAANFLSQLTSPNCPEPP